MGPTGKDPGGRTISGLCVLERVGNGILEILWLVVAHEHVEGEGLPEALCRGVQVLSVRSDPSFSDRPMNQRHVTFPWSGERWTYVRGGSYSLKTCLQVL
jgi:hypothetical protein